MKIIYSKLNYQRKDAYRLLTQIIEEKDNLLVRKTAKTDAARKHLKSMQVAYEQAASSLSNLAQPKILKSNPNSIDFEFIDSPSFSLLIENALSKKDFKEVSKLILEVKEIISSLKTEGLNPYDNNQFVEKFDLEQKFKSTAKEDCLLAGFFDLNFDNLLKAKSDCYFIDNEWWIDCPTPLKYLYFRALIQITYSFQQIIQTFASHEFPCLEIREGLIIPKEWLENFELQQSDLSKYFAYEFYLQHSSLVNCEATEILPEPFNIVQTRYSQHLGKILDTIESNRQKMNDVINQKLDEIKEYQERLKHYQKDIDTLTEDVRSITAEKEVIQKSFRWRLINKLFSPVDWYRERNQ